MNIKKLKTDAKGKTDPGAWERFEHAVDAAVASGPKHRAAPKPHKPPVKRRKPKKL